MGDDPDDLIARLRAAQKPPVTQDPQHVAAQERAKRPGAIEILREFVFANKPFETIGRCALRGGEHGDRCIWVSELASDPAQNDLATLRRQHPDYAAFFDFAIT